MEEQHHDGPTGETGTVLISSLSAPHDARVALRELLRDRYPSTLADAELVLSELVTNVVRHTNTGGSVRMLCGTDTVRIEISDGDRRLPVLRAQRPGHAGGRGLRLVDLLSTAWGVEPRAEGKTVWAEFNTSETVV